MTHLSSLTGISSYKLKCVYTFVTRISIRSTFIGHYIVQMDSYFLQQSFATYIVYGYMFTVEQNLARVC
jgi:hypothetical protein